MGILSGMVCGMFGIGAFLAAYLMGRAEEPEAVKGNLCMVFLVENTFRIWMYGTAGILPLSVIRQSLYLYGFMLAGLAVGLLLSGRINQRNARRVTGWMIDVYKRQAVVLLPAGSVLKLPAFHKGVAGLIALRQIL